MFNGHLKILSEATQPCVVTYNSARIRRLVRLVPGLYCFRVAANSAIGFSSSENIKARQCRL